MLLGRALQGARLFEHSLSQNELCLLLGRLPRPKHAPMDSPHALGWVQHKVLGTHHHVVVGARRGARLGVGGDLAELCMLLIGELVLLRTHFVRALAECICELSELTGAVKPRWATERLCPHVPLLSEAREELKLLLAGVVARDHGVTRLVGAPLGEHAAAGHAGTPTRVEWAACLYGGARLAAPFRAERDLAFEGTTVFPQLV